MFSIFKLKDIKFKDKRQDITHKIHKANFSYYKVKPPF